jgi:hypothetical protein
VVAIAASLIAVLSAVACAPADPWTDLTSADAATRVRAAERAGNQRSREAINKLVDLLYDPDPAVAGAAQTALGRMDGIGARLLMDHIAGTTDPGVRARLVRAVITIGPVAGREVAESLEIGSEFVPGAVREVFASYPEEGIATALTVLRDGPLAARRPLAEIVVGLGPSAVPAVIRAADPSHPRYLQELAGILARIGRPAIHDLVAALAAPDDRRAKALALQPLVAADFPAETVAAFGSPDPAVSGPITEALRVLGPAAQGLLVDALLLPDPAARTRALAALRDLGWTAQTAIDAARERYAQGKDDEARTAIEALYRDPATREAARAALERLGAAACPVAERLAKDADPALRAGAVPIIGGASCPGALDAAFDHFLYDRSGLVRSAALAAIRAAGADVGDRVRAMPSASLAPLVRLAEAQSDVVTLLVIADALPRSRAAATAERAIARATAAFAARNPGVPIDHIRTQQTTAVPRGVALAGVAEGEFDDLGGPYRIEVEIDEGGGSVLAYLEEAAVTKDRRDGARARYRYRLALEPRHTAPPGLVTVAGTVTVVRAGDGAAVARHAFVQDLDVIENRAFAARDVTAIVALARRAARAAGAVAATDDDPATHARRAEHRAALARYRGILTDLSRHPDPEISGNARLGLAILGN